MTIEQLAYSVDTFYLLVSAALVMWMAAGFSMLEAGMVRSKNTTEILVKNVLLYSIAGIAYLVIGYRLMYGTPNVETYAQQADFFFQMVFVATAMSIVSGAVAERMKLNSFLLFCLVLTAVIYPVQGSWSWGGGFLSELGFVDFAGSGIVHMAGAAASGAIGAFLLVRLKWQKADLTMILNGALAGLVAITAEPSAPTPLIACLIGLGAGVLVVGSILLLDRRGIDDPVGAISVHGVCGLYGLLLVAWTSADANILSQLLGAFAIFGWVFITSLVLWFFLKVTMGIRINASEERIGSDLTDCGVEAYPEFVSSKEN